MHLLHKTIVIRRGGELTLGKRYDDETPEPDIW